jgi:hypothetical protein
MAVYIMQKTRVTLFYNRVGEILGNCTDHSCLNATELNENRKCIGFLSY